MCLTQILQLVLHAIPLSRIHQVSQTRDQTQYLTLYPLQACDELQIFCSTCTPVQLAQLKFSKVLPLSAAQCGLITKSDAERLCSLLLREPSQRSPSPSSPPLPPASPAAVSPPRGDPTSFKVQHECFGDCVGVLHPQSYSFRDAKCIGRTVSAICYNLHPPEPRRVHRVSVLSLAPEVRQPQPQQAREQDLSLGLRLRQLDFLHSGQTSENFNYMNYTRTNPANARDCLKTNNIKVGFKKYFSDKNPLQIFEDYSEEEQEKYKEELESIKKRFSHFKLKRKWVSFPNGSPV